MATGSLAPQPLIYSIDDDASMNQLMQARFTKFGCEIQTFTTATALLEAISQRVPKLLVIDLNLGEGQSGFDVIETVRDHLKLEFPIIIVSSDSETVNVAHALEIGATDFVVKPPFRYQFEEKVAEYIEAANLLDYAPPALRAVPAFAQPAKVTFQMTLLEVNPLGFTLLSTHLIRKGSSFWLSGEILTKVAPSAEKVFVTVLGSATQLTGGQRLYQIRVEVDPGEEDIIQDIKAFSSSARIDA